jgi:hypothetical protein
MQNSQKNLSIKNRISTSSNTENNTIEKRYHIKQSNLLSILSDSSIPSILIKEDIIINKATIDEKINEIGGAWMLSKLGAVKIKITIAIETMTTIKNAFRRVFLCMHVKRILFGYKFFFVNELISGTVFQDGDRI